MDLGLTSRLKLEGVHPDLVKVVERAAELTTQAFVITCGQRSLSEQQACVAKGVSKTMNSKHRVQADGYSHAVDLAPFFQGHANWSWSLVYLVAAAVRAAALELGVELTWGGCWDRRLNDLPAGADGMKAASTAYCQRHPGPDFLDGPHFQLEPRP